MLEPLSSTLLAYVQAKVKECVILTSPIPIAGPMCSIFQYPIVAANIASIRNLLDNVTKLIWCPRHECQEKSHFSEMCHGRSGRRCDRAPGPVSMDQVGGSSDKAMKAILKGSRVQEANHAKTMCDVAQPGWRHCCLYRPNPGQYGITRTN